jgi:protein-disulfide isomerase
MIDVPTLNPPVSQRDHVLGPASAAVTLVEYGDYECPFCGAAYPIVKEVMRVLGSQLRFAFRNFPLTQVHPHAEHAAEAAETAAAQDKFWRMHDLLFEHQRALDEAHLLAYAATAGLDVKRFTQELGANAHAGRVREDFLSGVRSGVNGTPTFFINNERYNGAVDFDGMAYAISSLVKTS